MKKSELRFILRNLQTRVEMLENEQGFTDAVVEDLSVRVAELEKQHNPATNWTVGSPPTNLTTTYHDPATVHWIISAPFAQRIKP